MELISLGMDVLQNIAEHAASYRIGQSVLRQLDRTLWVVEKCARWAVPPPLDQDERPQPELVRPLPWIFFLMMLITLRVTRETISLANLVMGKPPLRSADVVMFIQGKRRYLRTLKYQGNRMMRARTSTQPQQPWYSGLNSLFELTMCFRRQSLNYGNNNTTRVTNNDEVMVVKRKRDRPDETANASGNESTMDRLIEKMMLDLDAESDEESSYTLTNATSPKSDRSDLAESDQDTICQTSPPTQPHDTEISQTNGDEIHFSPKKNDNSSSTPQKSENLPNTNKNSTPEKSETPPSRSENANTEMEKSENSPNRNENSGSTVENTENSANKNENATSTSDSLENHDVTDNHTKEKKGDQTFQISHSDTDPEKTTTDNSASINGDEKRRLEQNVTESAFANFADEKTNSVNLKYEDAINCEDSALPPTEERTLSPKQDTENFLKKENASVNSQRAAKKDSKIANGRTVKSAPSKKKVITHRVKRESNEAVQ